MLWRWVCDGVLDDPYLEFFVAADAEVSDDKLWTHKYSLREEMIPSFITSDQAEKVRRGASSEGSCARDACFQILVIGKTINFVRHCCGDVSWELDPALSRRVAALEYGDHGMLKVLVLTFK